MKLSATRARLLAAGALRGLGLEDGPANVVADHLLDAHTRRDGPMGLATIVTLEDRVAAAARQGRPIATVRETPTMALVDGGGNVGYVVAHHVTRLAIDKAAKHGVGCVGANNTDDTGRLGYYVDLAERNGFSAACAALEGGEVRTDGDAPAPAVVARLLAAIAQDPHAPCQRDSAVAFVILVMDPRRLVPGIGLARQRQHATVAAERQRLEDEIELPQSLHRALLKLGHASATTAG